MAINGVVTAIYLTANKPAVKRRFRIIKNDCSRLYPADILCSSGPELGRVSISMFFYLIK